MRIGIAYAVPPTSRKTDSWHDGFTAGVEIISARHEIDWWNVLDSDLGSAAVQGRLESLDVLLVKSSWQGTADRMTRPHLARRPSLPAGILVSGSGPPRRCDLGRFDVVFYQTNWYRDTLPSSGRNRWAFGIDTDVMKSPGAQVERDIDWLFVGTPVDYKRPLEILKREGRRVVVGDIDGIEESEIVTTLTEGGVEIHDFLDYASLAQYYQRSKNVLVPCLLHGGGERAVLEALACGARVTVPDDNPKLVRLLAEAKATSIPSHYDYGLNIEAGLLRAVSHPRARATRQIAHLQCGMFASRTALRARVGKVKRRIRRWQSA